MVGGGLEPGSRRGDHSVVVAAGQVDPGADLVRPARDLGVLGLGGERERGLAGGAGGLPVAGVVFHAGQQQRDPPGQHQVARSRSAGSRALGASSPAWMRVWMSSATWT